MFEGDAEAASKAKIIVKALSDYALNRAHSRHIHIDECRAIGLNILAVEDDPNLQDILLTVHHCYMHSLMNTPSFKMIENHLAACRT